MSRTTLKTTRRKFIKLKTENCLEVDVDAAGCKSLTERCFAAKSARYLIFSILLRFHVFLTVGATVVVVVVVVVKAVVVDVVVDVVIRLGPAGLYSVSSWPKIGVWLPMWDTKAGEITPNG